VNSLLNEKNSNLWITYPWVKKEERDFRYLPLELRRTQIDATFDSLRLTSGSHLWHRVVRRLLSVNVDAWCYVLTGEEVAQSFFMEELSAAIEKVPWHMGADFPLAGLTYGVKRDELPVAVRSHPCVSVEDPGWQQQIAELLRPRGALIGRDDPLERRYSWKVHPKFQGDPSLTAVEVGSKMTAAYWRFAVPGSCQPLKWGHGPSGGGQISPVRLAAAQGVIRYKERNFIWFGAANAISRSESAYIVYEGPLPEYVCFGIADSPFGPPAVLEILRTSMGRHALTESFR
jgi:hypothetical protein